jgi:tetratricopeptide (TPR) repeat protein
VSDDNPADKLSRRARRRAAQDQDEKPASTRASTKKQKARSPEPEGHHESEANEAGTAGIRDRNLRMREEAARRRRQKREGERKVAVAQGLDTSEMVDDALARATHSTTQWLRKHFGVLQWLIVVMLVGGVAWLVYDLRARRTHERAADDLMDGVWAELGRTRAAPADLGQTPFDTGLVDTRPTYDDDQARLRAALEAYREAEQDHGDWDGVVLTRMGVAGTQQQAGKFKEAKDLYEKIRDSQAATWDFDLKARAVEGIGLCWEALKNDEAALEAFRKLESLDARAYRPLAQYHQARILDRQGKTDKAKELAKKAFEKLSKDSSPESGPSFTLQAVRELLTELDPGALMEAEQRALAEQIKRMQQSMGKASGSDDASSTELEEVLKQVGTGVPEPGPGSVPTPVPSAVPAPRAPAPAGSQ